MNAPLTELKIYADNSARDAIKIARSDCIDAFASAETLLVALLARNGVKPAGTPFAQKIERIRLLSPGPRFSKEMKEKLPPLLDKLEALLVLRADLVHSKVEFATLDGQLRALFANARLSTEPVPVVRVATIESLRKLARSVQVIASRIDRLITPPSSPPPPSPAAAGGP